MAGSFFDDVAVLDLEVEHSPDWCCYCSQPESLHTQGSWGLLCPLQDRLYNTSTFTKIGWKDHARLGLAIGCYYSYTTSQYHWFDPHTLGATMQQFVHQQTLLVTYNGQSFDLPLMQAVEGKEVPGWGELSARSYDILARIWDADPVGRFQKGNSLDAVSQANGYGAKEMNGAQAPALWRAGRRAEVMNYCQGDVRKTRALFEQILHGRPLARPAGHVLLSLPQLVWRLNQAEPLWLGGMAHVAYTRSLARDGAGSDMPPSFDALPPPEQQAWSLAAAAVRRRVVAWDLTAEPERKSLIERDCFDAPEKG